MSINIENVTIRKSLSIKNAMNIIGDSSARILLVIDQEKKLLGTVTDGDLRRSMINDNDLDLPISEIMRINPVVGKYGMSENELLKIMTDKNLLAIPLLDSEGTLVGLETIHSLTKLDTNENQVLIMAGGFGKRLKPMTDETPKPLLSIEDGPLLEKLIQNLSLNGFKKIIISIHYKAEMIKDYFKDGSDWGIEIDYIEEDSPLGTGGSLRLLDQSRFNGLPFLVLNSDLVTTVDFRSMLDAHLQSGAKATICARQLEQIIPYGVISHKDSFLETIEEKPKSNYLINAGIYILDPSILGQLDNMKMKFDMTDFLQTLVNKGSKVFVFPIHEYWMDVGEIDDFKKARQDFNNKSK